MKRSWFVSLVAAIPFLTALRPAPAKAFEIFDEGGAVAPGPMIPNPHWFRTNPKLAVCFGQYDRIDNLSYSDLREHPYEPPSEARRSRAINYQEVAQNLHINAGYF